MEMIQCSIGKIGLITPTILYTELKSKEEVDLKHLQEFNTVASRLCKGKKCVSIILFNEGTFQTRDALDVYLREKSSEYIVARAIIIQDLPQALLARNTIKRSISNVKMAVFTSLSDARKWADDLLSHS